MKKLFFFIIFTLSVLANETDNTKLQNGLDAYKQKDFQKSYEIFSKLYLSYLANEDINFYLGRSAYETGHYEIALAAFERVSMLDPGNLRNKLEMARTYFMLKMYPDAQNLFEEVLKNNAIPKNVKTNIEFYLAKIKGVQKRSFTYANFSLDWVYDSNVNFASLDSNYNVGGVTLPTQDEKVDRAIQFYGDITNIYDFGKTGGFALKNRLNVYLKDYLNLDEYNIHYIGYKPSLLYKERRYLAELILGGDILALGGESYLKTLSVASRLEYNHSNILKSIFFIKYQSKFFSQDTKSSYDAHHYELGYSFVDILSPSSYFQTDIKGIIEHKKRSSTNPNVNYKEARLSLNYAKQFNAIYGMNLYAQVRKRAYDDRSSLFDSIRDDVGGVCAINLNAKVTKSIQLHMRGTYERTHSNQAIYSFQKHTVVLGVENSF